MKGAFAVLRLPPLEACQQLRVGLLPDRTAASQQEVVHIDQHQAHEVRAVAADLAVTEKPQAGLHHAHPTADLEERL